MLPWRDTTFGLLKRVASAAAERWPGYAAFATLQERGLRQDALAILRTFAEEMRGQRFELRWAFVSWLFEEIEGAKGVVREALVPFPLKVAVVLPTLREESKAATPRAEAFFWMARHYAVHVAEETPGSDDAIEAYLREGIRLTSDARLMWTLAAHLVGEVEYNGHHLFESVYLGNPDEDLRRLAQARQLLESAADPLQVEIDRAEEVVSAWQAYLASGCTDFGAWCRAHGVRPPTGIAVYYDP